MLAKGCWSPLPYKMSGALESPGDEHSNIHIYEELDFKFK